MKKILLFAAAAMVSLSSCVQTDEVYTGGVKEIGFKAGVTRAAIEEGKITEGNISVYGAWDADGAETAKNWVAYFTPTAVIEFKDNGSNVWSGAPSQYWPNAGHMQFIAHYPHNDGMDVTLDPATGIKGYAVTSIDNKAAQNDILFSDLCSVNSVPGAVERLLFHHALALLQVNFQTSLTTEEVKIVSATVADVVLGGNLTVTAAKPSTATWSNHLAAIDHTFANVTDAALTTAANTDATPLLILPSKTGEKQTEMTIVYTLNGHEMTTVVKLDTYGAWEMGNKYIYNFSIGANEIQFTCDVDEWTEVIVGGGITI